MTYILYFSAILTGMIFKKSKICTAWIYSVMVILAGFRYQSADYFTYTQEYLLSGQSVTSYTRYIGYYYFQRFFYELGFEFEQYLVIIYIIGFLLLIGSIHLLTRNVNFVLSLYLIYSFGIDAIQIKSFLANNFSLLGIVILLKWYAEQKNQFLISKKNYISIILFITLAILAILFHFSTVVYLICGLLYVLIGKRKYMTEKLFGFAIVILIFVYVGGISYVMNFASNIGILGDISYLNNWLGINTRFGWIFPVMLIIMIIFTAIYIDERKIKSTEIKISISKFILTSVLLIPFLIMDVTYFRLSRVYMLLLYIIFVNEKKSCVVKIRQGLSYLLFIVSIIYAYIYEIIPVYNNTLGSILKYNSLFL